MTRKDYVLIAEVFNSAWHDTRDERRVIDAVARDMADALGRDNPRFDRARFLEAAGVISGEQSAASCGVAS